MEIYFNTLKLDIDLLWKILVLLGLCVILIQVVKNNKLENLSRTVLDNSLFVRTEVDHLGYKYKRMQESITIVTHHFMASIKEGHKWYIDDNNLGKELARHWDHRHESRGDVKMLTPEQKTKLEQAPCKFFSDYGCSEYMDAILQVTAKYSQQ